MNTCTASSLLVLWPSQQSEKEYFELNYALNLCKRYLRESLLSKQVNFTWCEYGLNEISAYFTHPKKYTLIVRDPLLMMSASTVIQLMQLIDLGYEAVGPSLNKSQCAAQVASPFFPVFNISTFEELNNFYSENIRPEIIDVNKLDPSCVLVSEKYIDNHFTDPNTLNSIKYNSSTDGCRFGILRNSYTFSFKDSDNYSREDLLVLIPEGIRILLDVGCSQGSLGVSIKKTRPEIEIEGLELNRLLAARASSVYDKVYVCSLEEFVCDKNYDCIICGDVLEHLFDPWTQLKSLFRILKPGGHLILSLPNAGHWTLVADLAASKFDYLPWGITCITHLRWFTENSIRKALGDAGFNIVLFECQQTEPTPAGKAFISKIVASGIGNERSLLTHGFLIKAIRG